MDFGQEVKALRINAGISSRELSKRIGKAVTYVSQLERGLIKIPDYATCFKLMREVGIEENRIEGLLNWFNIKSPEQIQIEDEILQRSIEEEERRMEEDPEGYMQYQIEQMFYLETVRLKDMSDMIYHSLNVLIDKDFSKAEVVIENLDSLMKQKEDLDFFCSLFKHDYSRLSSDEKDTLLQMIDTFFSNRDAAKGETKE